MILIMNGKLWRNKMELDCDPEERPLPKWESYARDVKRIKVDGGYLYQSHALQKEYFTTCFVPDVDLQRYESHLRDAYTQGYADGQADFREMISIVKPEHAAVSEVIKESVSNKKNHLLMMVLFV